jgi:hypothetical protein
MILVDDEPSLIISIQPSSGEIKLRCRPGAANTIERLLGNDLLATF